MTQPPDRAATQAALEEIKARIAALEAERLRLESSLSNEPFQPQPRPAIDASPAPSSIQHFPPAVIRKIFSHYHAGRTKEQPQIQHLV
jgi:hypothetical protein